MKNLYYPGPKKFGPLRVKTWLLVIILVLIQFIIGLIGWNNRYHEKSLDQAVSHFLQFQVHAQEKHYPIQNPTTEQEKIVEYIEEVFGSDAPRAFKLLQCENSTLNPDMVNTANNHPAGSRDIGVFSINEYWQQVPAKFLFNWKINVQIAHQLFVENNKTFSLWTCGGGI